jgi:hypothetical protein
MAGSCKVARLKDLVEALEAGTAFVEATTQTYALRCGPKPNGL